jgi:UDP-N-acetylmuramoyl-L-alanyl-D-glutamate--2,6-diaminopimelate ligase
MMAAAVAAMTLGQLLGPAAGARAELAVSDLVSDSRQVTPGSAFFALPGERSHGLQFADQALAAGAVVVIYDPDAAAEQVPPSALPVAELKARLGEFGRRFYGPAQPDQELIGVTGTNGKTTVAWLVAQALTKLGRSCGYIGTLGYGSTDKLTKHALTTPDCLSLHRELAELGMANAVLEVSSHALAQGRVSGLGFTLAAFTNLSRDHLDWHGSMDAYFAAKARLFVCPGLKAAVINVDDPYGEALLQKLEPGTRGISLALAREADIVARVASRGLSGLVIELSDGARIESPLIGEFNAENLLLAYGLLVATGTDGPAASAGLSQALPPPGRMEVFGGPPAGPWVVVDYAHTPLALERVLSELSAITTGAITCVFGCGGDRDRGKRAPMGEVAARYAAHVILTDDNPRSEDPVAIVADIKSGIGRHPDLRVEHRRERAIVEAIQAAGTGDVVLVAGKGHETLQLTGGVARAFDDRALVRQTLEGVS